MSSSLLSSGRVRFEGRGGQVGVEGPLPVEGLVGSDAVVFVGEGGDVFGEVDAVGDVLSVEALVFEGFEPALDDAVGVRGATLWVPIIRSWALTRGFAHQEGVVEHDTDLGGGLL